MSHKPAAAKRQFAVQRGGAQHNFLVLILYSVLVRTGWIFKTESIIMPAILDSVGGGGWMRGCLPMLNRVGQSLPPLLASERIRRAPCQKNVLSTFITLMGASFLVLSLTWSQLKGSSPAWLPYFFLIIYGFFWLCAGLHNLSISLLYGKLVAANARGRLMLVGMTLGAVSAISCAWVLMRPWLAGGSEQFLWLFLFTGSAFVLAGLVALGLSENPDSKRPQVRSLKQTMTMSIALLLSDKNFRLLALVAATFGMSVTLMPHYQAYARQSLNLGFDSMVPWVIAQNLGAAAFSIPVGRIADRFGNRLAVRCVLLVLCCAPVLTVLIVNLFPWFQQLSCCLVFFLLGLMPVTMRIFNNYTLELTDRHRQPIYLSTLGICMALPVIVMSTAVGALVDSIGFELVFLVVVTILFLGWTLTFKLREPRTTDLGNGRTSRESIGLE